MAGDDALLFGLHAEELAHAGRHEAVASAVCAPAADVVLLVILVGDGIHIGVLGHGLVEGGVEHEDLGQLGQHCAHGFVALEVGGAVQRSELHVLVPFLKHFGGHNLALREASASHDAMACGGDFVQALDGAIFGIEQGVKHQFDSLGVRGTGRFDNFRLAIDFGLEEGALKADFLDTTGGQNRLVVHLVKLVLDRTATAVDN